MDVSALARCVGDVDGFFARHWDRSPLLRVTEDGFDDLASLDDLDHMISSLGLHASELRMVRAGKTLPPANYTRAPGRRSRGTEPLIEPAAVYSAYDQGATIVLESLHRYWRPLTDFCRDLELALGHRLQVNAYITPPRSQGFDVHRDTHDVFVLQVSGAKHWIVYDRTDEESVLVDAEIEPGHALYIPTGFPHAATTGEGASAHLTVGILTYDGREILRETLKLAEDEPSFQARLPVALDENGLRITVGERLDELRTWLDKVDVDELTRGVARRVMPTAQPLVRGQLRQLDALDMLVAASRVTRRRGSIVRLFPGPTHITVILTDRELEMPLKALGALELISARDAFEVHELHQHLSADSALVLVRRLVREGLLEVDLDA